MQLNEILCSTSLTLGCLLMASALCAAEPDKAAVNPTGTWEFRTITSGKQSGTPQTLKLKFDGAKLTGTLSRNAGNKVEQVPLEDATLKGNEISFATHVYALVYQDNVLQPTDTNKVTLSKYQARITGDSMKGKVEKKSWRDEYSRTQDWQATRLKGAR